MKRKRSIYHEIARFRSQRLAGCLEALFYTLVKLLGEKGEICYEHLFVDGTKIEANANKYSFVWKKRRFLVGRAYLSAGQETPAAIRGIRRSKSGFESQISYYECEGCDGCPGKKQCARSRGNRKLQVSKRFIAQRAESLARIISGKGIMLRMNRSIQVEETF